MLSHTNLAAYYTNMFGLIQHHGYSLSDLEDTIPYERYIYIDMLMDYLEKLKEKQK